MACVGRKYWVIRREGDNISFISHIFLTILSYGILLRGVRFNKDIIYISYVVYCDNINKTLTFRN